MLQDWLDFSRGDDLLQVEMVIVCVIAIIIAAINCIMRGYV